MVRSYTRPYVAWNLPSSTVLTGLRWMPQRRRTCAAARRSYRWNRSRLRLLEFLIENRDRVLGKEEIFRVVWNETSVTDNSLTRAIARRFARHWKTTPGSLALLKPCPPSVTALSEN